MIKTLIYRILTNTHRRHGISQIRRLESKLITKALRFAIPFVYRGKGFFKKIEPRQNPYEILSLYQLVCDRCPQNLLEIGTARGGTLYLWAQAAKKDATIVSVDLPDGEFGGSYPACRVPFYQCFTTNTQKLHLLRKDSHHPRTVEEVKQLFGGPMVDFAFIDGDHSYEGVKADFFNYAPLVKSGGIIALHDILPYPPIPEIQVSRFWKEIRDSYKTEEIIDPESHRRKIGIGVVFVE